MIRYRRLASFGGNIAGWSLINQFPRRLSSDDVPQHVVSEDDDIRLMPFLASLPRFGQLASQDGSRMELGGGSAGSLKNRWSLLFFFFFFFSFRCASLREDYWLVVNQFVTTQTLCLLNFSSRRWPSSLSLAVTVCR